MKNEIPYLLRKIIEDILPSIQYLVKTKATDRYTYGSETFEIDTHTYRVFYSLTDEGNDCHYHISVKGEQELDLCWIRNDKISDMITGWTEREEVTITGIMKKFADIVTEKAGKIKKSYIDDLEIMYINVTKNLNINQEVIMHIKTDQIKRMMNRISELEKKIFEHTSIRNITLKS